MSRTVVTDSSDEAQVTKAQKEQEDRDRDLSYILKEPRGRRWLYELIFATCHVSHLSHVPGDVHSTAFNEGARSIGERVLAEIQSRDFGKYLAMLEENRDDA